MHMLSPPVDANIGSRNGVPATPACAFITIPDLLNMYKVKKARADWISLISSDLHLSNLVHDDHVNDELKRQISSKQ
jgi:hypothetical protein